MPSGDFDIEREFRVGEWRFRPDVHQLEGPGGEVQLEPRTADVLHDLARNANRVRTRDELLATVWGDAFVGEAVLTHCIWQLRKCFDDDVRQPRYIKTVAGRGYRLIATTIRQRAPAVRTLVAVAPLVSVSIAAQVQAAVAQMGGADVGGPGGGGTPHAALLVAHQGTPVASAEGTLIAFERPVQAVRYALALQSLANAGDAEPKTDERCRIGIDMDEVRIRSVTAMDTGEVPVVEVEGPATDRAARLLALAEPGQTLLTRGAFDLARRRVGDDTAVAGIQWLAHGPYQLAGLDEPLGLFEVGVAGIAPMRPPPDSERARRGLGDGTILGWRPAPGQTLPARPQWLLIERLGEGGFGEVWLAQHAKTGEQRVFKFCYDAARLRALQREVTIFRLIKEELGERSDIGRILDWNFETAPYFLELEYTASGSLVTWSDEQGGLDAVPVEDRLRLVCEAAVALAAAHSVGVLHKDIKPSNILIYVDPDGRPRSRLTDFGIGRLTDRGRLVRAGVTAVGLTMTQGSSSLGSEAGTSLYWAPELVEGRSATIQADIYALGVVLYQLTVGDLGRALAPGWEREIGDDLLREDIAVAVDGVPERRLTSALALAERLEGHARRKAEQAEAEQRAVAQARNRRRRRWALLAVSILAAVVAVLTVATVRISQEASRANQEARAARKVATFLGDLFRDAEPGEDLGRTYTASELLDLGASKAEDELSDQPLIQAELLNIIGTAYRRLGALDEATGALDTALALRRTHAGTDDLVVAESLHDKAVLLTEQAEWSTAEDYHREALAIRRAKLGEPDPLVAQSLHDLGWLLRVKGTPESAEPLYREALAIRREAHGDQSLEVASSVSSLALCLRAQGDLKGAEPLYREALALRRSLLGERHLGVAASLNNLAGLLRSRGDAAQAVPYLRQTLDIRREHMGDEHPDVASAINNLARALRIAGAYEEAKPLFEEALALRRRLLGDRHPRVAQTQTYLAELWLDMGAAADAERMMREALSTLRQALDADHWRIDYAESVLGGALTALGRFAEAEALLLGSYETLRAERGDASTVAREARGRIDALYEAWGRRR